MSNLLKRLPRLKSIEIQSAIRFQEAENKYLSVVKTHNQLTAYRTEYKATNAVLPALIMDAQCFIERLDKSIKQVNESMQQLERLVTVERSRWLADRARVKAVEKLCERAEVEVRHESQKNERRVAESLLVYRQTKTVRK